MKVKINWTATGKSWHIMEELAWGPCSSHEVGCYVHSDCSARLNESRVLFWVSGSQFPFCASKVNLLLITRKDYAL